MPCTILRLKLRVRGVQVYVYHESGKAGGSLQRNNGTPFLAGLFPRAAVTDVRVESIGRHAIEQMLWRLAHPEVSERLMTCFEPRLIRPTDLEEAK